ncbi:hypothetical protein [Bradyrhizobium sp. Arg816]|uniref:hypothetical protein n=1 Tax=Bradyrhizobium sp. Arg816 TaxID=2998491 RepID=UPI00249DE69D|nr:hypothetical protein [Bradyrhizobium sp. Arg816]MDI3565947.1 hypothetical protein [Bradyrhizobium sp. Arg816]
MRAMVSAMVFATISSYDAAHADSSTASAARAPQSAKMLDNILQQPRTSKSDEVFRKSAPPPGTVRLSNRALAVVKSFMHGVRRAMPEGDQIAWIGWVKDQAVKGPNDTNWTSHGAGWVLGAYPRAQVPPDIIDTVRGVEIVFTTNDDPSSLTGKTIDVANHKFFVHD